MTKCRNALPVNCFHRTWEGTEEYTVLYTQWCKGNQIAGVHTACYRIQNAFSGLVDTNLVWYGFHKELKAVDTIGNYS